MKQQSPRIGQRSMATGTKKCFGCDQRVPNALPGDLIWCVFRYHAGGPRSDGGYPGHLTQHQVCPECYRRERG